MGTWHLLLAPPVDFRSKQFEILLGSVPLGPFCTCRPHWHPNLGCSRPHRKCSGSSPPGAVVRLAAAAAAWVGEPAQTTFTRFTRPGYERAQARHIGTHPSPSATTLFVEAFLSLQDFRGPLPEPCLAVRIQRLPPPAAFYLPCHKPLSCGFAGCKPPPGLVGPTSQACKRASWPLGSIRGHECIDRRSLGGKAVVGIIGWADKERVKPPVPVVCSYSKLPVGTEVVQPRDHRVRGDCPSHKPSRGAHSRQLPLEIHLGEVLYTGTHRRVSCRLQVGMQSAGVLRHPNGSPRTGAALSSTLP
jgi:hypothetical protein